MFQSRINLLRGHVNETHVIVNIKPTSIMRFLQEPVEVYFSAIRSVNVRVVSDVQS